MPAGGIRAPLGTCCSLFSMNVVIFFMLSHQQWKLIIDLAAKYKITVKILNIRTPEKFAVIILKFEQHGYTIVKCVQKM